MVRIRGTVGENDGESCDEEEREHRGDEDPVREEAPEAETAKAEASSASASAAAPSDGDRHWSDNARASNPGDRRARRSKFEVLFVL